MNAKLLTVPASLALLNVAFLVAVGALVALPLGAGAVPAGVAAAATSAVVAGLIVSLLTRVSFEVTTPASSVGVIYAALAAQLATQPDATFVTVWAGLSLAVMLMGLLLLAAAWLRLADAVRFLPAPVSAGFLTGIGLLVLWSQAGPLLGIAGKLELFPSSFAWSSVRPAAILVAAVAALTVYGHQKLKLPGPGNVIALLLATLVHHAAAWGGADLGSTVGAVQSLALHSETLAGVISVEASVRFNMLYTVLPYAAFLALQAIMNLAVVMPVASALTGQAVAPHRTLRAQGLANLACGALAALPVSTHAVISLSAARQKSSWRDIAWSCLLVFGIMFLIGGLLPYLPLAALAGTLVMAGINLIDKWARSLLRSALRSRGKDREVMLNLGLVSAVAASFILGSVPLALLVGSVLAMFLLALSLSRASSITVEDAARQASTRVWPAEQAAWLSGQRRRITIVRPRGGLFFGTADQLSRALLAVDATQSHCIVDMGKLATLDATGCQLLAAGARRLQAQGTSTLLAGLVLTSREGAALVALGLDTPAPVHWFPDVDHALEYAEHDLLHREGPSDASSAGLSGTPIGRDIPSEEAQVLQAILVRRDVPAGPLFLSGDPATSLFVVESGCVEIQVHNREAGRTTRLASFGPGSVFGEVSLLSTGLRTADACCTEPTVLHELTREALNSLEQTAPRLHAQVLRNLGVHLANRLVIATSILLAQQ